MGEGSQCHPHVSGATSGIHNRVSNKQLVSSKTHDEASTLHQCRPCQKRRGNIGFEFEINACAFTGAAVTEGGSS